MNNFVLFCVYRHICVCHILDVPGLMALWLVYGLSCLSLFLVSVIYSFIVLWNNLHPPPFKSVPTFKLLASEFYI